jgi:hypothetical protein
VFFYKKNIMENSKSTPISSNASISGSPSTSKDHKSSTPQSTPVPQSISPAKGVGGDQKSGTKASDVVKESKDITAA